MKKQLFATSLLLAGFASPVVADVVRVETAYNSAIQVHRFYFIDETGAETYLDGARGQNFGEALERVLNNFDTRTAEDIVREINSTRNDDFITATTTSTAATPSEGDTFTNVGSGGNSFAVYRSGVWTFSATAGSGKRITLGASAVLHRYTPGAFAEDFVQDDFDGFFSRNAPRIVTGYTLDFNEQAAGSLSQFDFTPESSRVVEVARAAVGQRFKYTDTNGNTVIGAFADNAAGFQRYTVGYHGLATEAAAWQTLEDRWAATGSGNFAQTVPLAGSRSDAITIDTSAWTGSSWEERLRSGYNAAAARLDETVTTASSFEYVGAIPTDVTDRTYRHPNTGWDRGSAATPAPTADVGDFYETDHGRIVYGEVGGATTGAYEWRYESARNSGSQRWQSTVGREPLGTITGALPTASEISSFTAARFARDFPARPAVSGHYQVNDQSLTGVVTIHNSSDFYSIINGALDDAFDAGYDEGYADGYEDGFEAGYTLGFQDGVDSVTN